MTFAVVSIVAIRSDHSDGDDLCRGVDCGDGENAEMASACAQGCMSVLVARTNVRVVAGTADYVLDQSSRKNILQCKL